MSEDLTVTGVSVDLNADLAEGDHLTAADEDVLDSVTSASLACGFHAGNRSVMRAAAAACVRRGVSIGAHVAFRDRAGFGRRHIEQPPSTLIDDLIEQCATLAEEVVAAGGTVVYVKPHGALYHRMETDTAVAECVVEATSRQVGVSLVAPPRAVAVELARRAGLPVVLEGFPDRGYLPSGRLVPRDRPGALVTDPLVVARRAVSLALARGLQAIDGSWAPVHAGTLCVHGDSPGAADTARSARAALEAAGIAVQPFAGPGAAPSSPVSP